MALQNRKSLMAIVEETTEGTPVVPASASEDYIALQDGFSLSASFTELENDELTGSIGQAKSILGFEEPTADISHYMKHSGVEGQEPNFGLLIESIQGGKEVEAVEYDTIAGSTAGDSSTRGKVVVDSGEGAQYERGQGLLIKDGANGYSIRNVYDVSTDDLNLGFNLAAAPALGVNLGKAVLYKPADEGHPTFSSWVYRANGGAIEMMAGSRVSEMTIEATAGELVNASFSIAGIEYFFNPIEVTASSKFLDFDDGLGPYAAQVAEKVYKDPYELASALQTAMDTLSSDNITVSYNKSNGKFTIASDGAQLDLDWSSGANSANSIGALIGFDVGSDDTGSLSYESDNEQSYVAPQVPSFDSTAPIVAKSNEVMFGDFYDNVCFEASSVTVTESATVSNLLSVCAESGKEGTLITEREVSVELVARLEKHDAEKFHKFHTNENVQFMYNLGEKSGGNWVAGKAVNMFIPTATIVSYELQDTDGVIELAMSLSAYVANGQGEFYVNFL